MKNILIKRDFAGAPDHLHTRPYKTDEVYPIGHHHMPGDFAEILLREGYAEPSSVEASMPQGVTTDAEGNLQYEDLRERGDVALEESLPIESKRPSSPIKDAKHPGAN